MPFVYYSDLTNNTAVCNDRVVDFDQNFEADLASNQYRYMWITPNMCNDMHNCAASVSDKWLEGVVTKIMASDAYKNGGAIFITFDEGSSRAPGAGASLPTIVVSPNLDFAGPVIDVRYLWFLQKRYQGSHLMNDEQALAFNELVRAGKVVTTLGHTYAYGEIPEAHQLMGDGQLPEGNVSCLVGAAEPGMGAA